MFATSSNALFTQVSESEMETHDVASNVCLALGLGEGERVPVGWAGVLCHRSGRAFGGGEVGMGAARPL
jgi:hypothetical protein